MPTGIFIDSICILSGGLLGAWFGNRLDTSLKNTLNGLFGLSALTMGITSVVLIKNLPPVILSLILGTLFGAVLNLTKLTEDFGAFLSRKIPGNSPAHTDTEMLTTVMVLFCASGTGIYGSLVSGITGDHTILIAKSILDFFTAMIFACSLGKVTAMISIPQFFIFLVLFVLSRLIMPMTTQTMIDDFKACGGILMLATGFRILKIKSFPIADMLPAMFLVFPLSALWTQIILPLL